MFVALIYDHRMYNFLTRAYLSSVQPNCGNFKVYALCHFLLKPRGETVPLFVEATWRNRPCACSLHASDNEYYKEMHSLVINVFVKAKNLN